MAENLPNGKKEADIEVQEEQRAPSKMNLPRRIIIKTANLKIQRELFKAAREKQESKLQGKPHEYQLISL